VTIAASSGSAPSNACEAGKGVSKACLGNNIQSSDTKANFAEQNYKNTMRQITWPSVMEDIYYSLRPMKDILDLSNFGCI
jgi:hypothetical protein